MGTAVPRQKRHVAKRLRQGNAARKGADGRGGVVWQI